LRSAVIFADLWIIYTVYRNQYPMMTLLYELRWSHFAGALEP
jgi:hypothetical protein